MVDLLLLVKRGLVWYQSKIWIAQHNRHENPHVRLYLTKRGAAKGYLTISKTGNLCHFTLGGKELDSVRIEESEVLTIAKQIVSAFVKPQNVREQRKKKHDNTDMV